jgi:hypothetical protein
MSTASIEKALDVKKRFEAELLNLDNVVGVGVGLRQIAGAYTDEIALIIMVKRKVDRGELTADALLPEELEGVTVDVQEVGEIQAGS